MELLYPLMSAWVPDVRHSPPLLAYLVDGRAVSVCGSVRITPEAHEAGVETAAEYRGQGCAPQVVAEWAQAVRALGIEPLYSTSWANAASRAVARKLALVQFGSDLPDGGARRFDHHQPRIAYLLAHTCAKHSESFL